MLLLAERMERLFPWYERSRREAGLFPTGNICMGGPLMPEAREEAGLN